MVFSSALFLFLFLPFTLCGYFLIHKACQGAIPRLNFFLLVCSVLFYAWGAPKSAYLIFFILSIVIDYYLAFFLRGPRRGLPGFLSPRMLLGAAVTLNIVFLGYFKYANFFVLDVGGLLGNPANYWQAVALPIGISFFVFHKISYLLDVYRGKVEPKLSLVDYSLYILLFPQLIAGPIVRYHTIADQISGRRHSLDGVFEGMWRFAVGLGKKTLIANQIGAVSDLIFSLPPEELSMVAAWLGVLIYSFQIYFDFSGYSDMAIGLGLMFGLRLPENFNRPYISASVTEFWRRWHITLSHFFRDYVYIPLGGNRASLPKTLINLWIVFLLCGFWHGANWNFIFWGAYFGAWLTLERIFLGELLEKAPRFLAVGYTFLVVLIGWVFFRSPDIAHSLEYLGRMGDVSSLAFSHFAGRDLEIDYGLYPKVIILLAVAATISFIPQKAVEKVSFENIPIWGKGAATLALLGYSIVTLATGTFNPFLYFQF